MLKFKKVSKSFGEIEALKDVSLEVDKGEFVFITGPSGAGKTTLLKLLIREYDPTSGEIIFDGKEIQNLKRKEIPELRRMIGAVFQDYRLLGERTVEENIEVALAVKGVSKQEWEARVEHVLGLVGIEERARLFPSQLSGGELQRATLARALALDPILLFADEPTGNLDPETSEGILDLLTKINDEGRTVIVSTHDMDIVNKAKKRVVKLKDGEVVTEEKEK